MRRLRAHRHPREVREGAQRLPGVRPAPPHRGRGVHRAPDRSAAPGASCGPASGRSIRSASSTTPTGWCRPRKKGGRCRRDLHRQRPARWAAVQPRRDEFRLHGRLDGLGGRREDRAARATLPREEDPAGPRLHLGRRADAGRRALPHADGQDLGRHRPAPPRLHPLHLHPDRPDHRRRVGLLRDAGRRDPRGAGRASSGSRASA